MRGLSHEHDPWRALDALKAAQFGIFSAEQSAALGISEDALFRAVSVGRLERCLPRTYRDPGVPQSWEQRLMAAQLWAGRGAAISHRAAAALHGLWGFEPGPIELTAPIARRSPAGIRVFRGLLGGADVITKRPLQIASATRTLIDLAAVVDEEAVEIALDSALHHGLTSIDYLTSRLASLGTQGRRGAGTLSRLLYIRAPHPKGLESPLETKFLRLLRRARLPVPHTGFQVGPYRLDFAFPEASLGIELEGHEYHSGKKALMRDVARRNYFLELGWSILYFTWDDVTKDSSKVVLTVGGHLFPRLVT